MGALNKLIQDVADACSKCVGCGFGCYSDRVYMDLCKFIQMMYNGNFYNDPAQLRLYNCMIFLLTNPCSPYYYRFRKLIDDYCGGLCQRNTYFGWYDFTYQLYLCGLCLDICWFNIYYDRYYYVTPLGATAGADAGADAGTGSGSGSGGPPPALPPGFQIAAAAKKAP